MSEGNDKVAQQTERIDGIHHITAIASDPQTNVDFYAGVLGLRLVKRTVNFDDPQVYHLYYGDATGSPGTILTFFPWPGARRGSRGVGQATVTAFSVPEGSLGYWRERLSRHGIVAEAPKTRGEEEILTLLDPDGLKLELVAHAGAAAAAPWGDGTGGPVPDAHAVRRFFGLTLQEQAYEPTAETLETLGFPLLGEDSPGAAGKSGGGSRFRFDAGQGARLDVIRNPDGGHGHIAAGTVHHVAWRVTDDAEQLRWREKIAGAGLHVTPVLDRQYFHSIYFREPGGVLFEIATDPPGFILDESVASLGSALKLPPWLESDRDRIARRLPRLELDGVVTGGQS